MYVYFFRLISTNEWFGVNSMMQIDKDVELEVDSISELNACLEFPRKVMISI